MSRYRDITQTLFHFEWIAHFIGPSIDSIFVMLSFAFVVAVDVYVAYVY